MYMYMYRMLQCIWDIQPERGGGGGYIVDMLTSFVLMYMYMYTVCACFVAVTTCEVL